MHGDLNGALRNIQYNFFATYKNIIESDYGFFGLNFNICNASVTGCAKFHAHVSTKGVDSAGAGSTCFTMGAINVHLISRNTVHCRHRVPGKYPFLHQQIYNYCMHQC